MKAAGAVALVVTGAVASVGVLFMFGCAAGHLLRGFVETLK